MLTANLIFGVTTGGVWLALTGDTYQIRDKLKAIGCRYVDLPANCDVLGASPQKRWALYISKRPWDSDFEDKFSSGAQKILSLGAEKVFFDSSPMAALNYQIAREIYYNNKKKEV
jgi:hypothetical protein